MKTLREFLIASLYVAVLATNVASAASTTNYSDEWWVQSESGWGVAVQQQGDMLFVQISVYGADNQAMWLTASAVLQTNGATGRDVFVGDLFQTAGRYYGAAGNAVDVGYRKVGNLTFDAADANAAALTYTVDGVTVARNLTRLTWGGENLTGTYQGGWTATCGDYWWPWVDSPVRIEISHRADHTVTMVLRHVEPEMQYLDPLTMTGTYSQSGRLGQIVANVVGGGSGSITFYEMEKTVAGFTGRMKGTITLGIPCPLVNGRIGMSLR